MAAEVHERIRAIPVLFDLLPSEPAARSAFAEDAELLPFATYDVVRTRLQDAVAKLLLASRVAEDETQSRYATHLIVLRPALVAAAKGLWIVEPHEAIERAARTCALIATDRKKGLEAMANASKNGGPDAFAQIGTYFQNAQASLETVASELEHPVKLPRDLELIMRAASRVDVEYGTEDATFDAGLLWNSSSGLAHGERWYPDLVQGESRRSVAEMLTNRSLDIVCSMTNLLAQRTSYLSLARP